MSELARQRENISAVKQRLGLGRVAPVNVAKLERERAEIAEREERQRVARLQAEMAKLIEEAKRKREEAELNRDPATDPKLYLHLRAVELGFEVDDIVGPSHDHRTSAARHRIMVELRTKFQNMSYSKIGKMFGGRHHTTVLNAMNRMKKKQETADVQGA